MIEYTNQQKTAIVFSLLGESQSEAILQNLPKEIVKKIQSEILPMIGSIDLPNDIDSFVLEEIIKDDDSASSKNNQESPQAAESQTAEETTTEEQKVIDWDSLTLEQILDQAPLRIVADIIRKENKGIQALIMQLLPEKKKEEIEEKLVAMGLEVPKAAMSNKIISTMQEQMKDVLLKKIAGDCKKQKVHKQEI